MKLTNLAVTVCLISLTIASFAWGGNISPTAYDTYNGQLHGGREMAIGYAVSAVADGPSSVYYNPAGLYSIKSNLLGFSYEISSTAYIENASMLISEMRNNRKLIFLTLTSTQGSFSFRPLSNSTFHLINVDGWEENEVKVNAYSISTSHEHSPKLYSGLTLNYLSGRIGSSGIRDGNPYVKLSDGNGFSMDMGFIYLIVPELRLGIMLKNLTGFMWWSEYEKDILPFVFRSGLAYQIPGFITFSSDIEKYYYRQAEVNEVQTIHFGLEQSLGKILKLRVGMYGTDLNNSEVVHLTAGAGYVMNNYTLSLAGEKYNSNNGDIYRYIFSLDLPL